MGGRGVSHRERVAVEAVELGEGAQRGHQRLAEHAAALRLHTPRHWCQNSGRVEGLEAVGSAYRLGLGV